MSIVADCRTYLLTQSAVTDLISTRIYWDNLPQNATLPAIVLEMPSGEVADRNLAATGMLFRDAINCYCYASTHTAAAALGDAVYAALEFDSGTWGTTTVTRCFVENTQDVMEPPRDGSDAFRRVRALFAVVWHR